MYVPAFSAACTMPLSSAVVDRVSLPCSSFTVTLAPLTGLPLWSLTVRVSDRVPLSALSSAKTAVQLSVSIIASSSASIFFIMIVTSS